MKVNSFLAPAADHPQIVIVAYDDDDNYIRSGYGMIDSTPRLVHATEIESSFDLRLSNRDLGPSPFHLQLRKTGTLYTQFYSTDGVSFTQANEPLIYGDGTPAKLGFVAMVDPTESSLAVIDSFTVEAPIVVDFEHIPGLGLPVDGMAISNQFLADFGITFSFEGGGYPVLAKVGPPITAFVGPPPIV